MSRVLFSCKLPTWSVCRPPGQPWRTRLAGRNGRPECGCTLRDPLKRTRGKRIEKLYNFVRTKSTSSDIFPRSYYVYSLSGLQLVLGPLLEEGQCGTVSLSHQLNISVVPRTFWQMTRCLFQNQDKGINFCWFSDVLIIFFFQGSINDTNLTSEKVHKYTAIV